MPEPARRPRVNLSRAAPLHNARGGTRPDPVRAAPAAEATGADGSTAPLRTDRRRIRNADIAGIMAAVRLPLNFAMAATPEMRAAGG